MPRPQPSTAVAIMATAVVAALLPLIALSSAHAGTSTVTSVTTADAYVSSAAAKSKYGSAKVLRVSGKPSQRSYLTFQVSNVTGPVTKAVLTLTPTKSAAVPLEVRQVTGTWSEGSVTWATAPALGAVVGSTANVPATKLSIDVTTAVTGNGAVNLAVQVPASSATSSVVAEFASREVANMGATLAVSFTPPDTTPPASPVGLSATAGDGDASLAWSPSTETDLAGYRVYRRLAGTTLRPERIATLATTSASFKDTALVNGNTYEYQLTAVDTAGNESAPSATATATPQPPPDTTPPAVPTGLTITSGDSLAALTWKANDDPDLAGYRVYRRLASDTSQAVRVGNLATTAMSYEDLALTNGKTYEYQLTAVDTAGNESDPSATATATPQPPPDTTPPAVPAGLTISSGDSLATLTWKANDDPDLAGYRIYRRAPDTTWPMAHLTELTATTWSDIDLTNGSTFEYRLTAVDFAGNESAPSEMAIATPQPPPDTTPPAAPTGLTITSGDSSHMLTWQAGEDPDLVGYRVYRRGPETPWPATHLTELTVTTWTDTDLLDGSLHDYRVTAVDAAGNESAPSATVTPTPPTPPTPTPEPEPEPDITAPAVPAGLTVSSGNSLATLTWEANGDPDLAGYRVYRRGPDAAWSTAHLTELTATTWTDIDLSNGSLHDYRVTAVDAAGNESAPSAVAPGVGGLGWSPSVPAVPANGVVRPEEYGAKGDGITDDAAALQRAVDDAAVRGMKVELGAKTYLLGSRLLLPSQSYLSGVGSASVLQFTWTVNDPAHDGLYLGNKDQVDQGNTDITLTNFAIRGAGSGLPEGLNATHDYPRVPGIRFRLVDRFEISQMEISHVPGISLLNQGSSDGLIQRNYVHHAGRDGINTGWHLRASHHVLVLANHIEKVGDDAVALLGANGGTTGVDQWSYKLAAVGNTLAGWQTDPNGKMLGRGIAVMSVKDSDVRANVIDSTHSDGILVAPAVSSTTGAVYRSADVRLDGNVIKNAGQLGAGGTTGNGVAVKRSDRILFSATTIINPKSKPMVFYDCNGCSAG